MTFLLAGRLRLRWERAVWRASSNAMRMSTRTGALYRARGTGYSRAFLLAMHFFLFYFWLRLPTISREYLSVARRQDRVPPAYRTLSPARNDFFCI
jgi:hypothetical protein